NYQGKGTSSIGTFGVGPCIGFVLHESGTNSGMVAHFDSDATGPVHNALIVAQDLYSEFKKHAGDKVQTYIVIGSGPDISTDTIARTLYTVCENNGMDPILTKADSGDFFLSLKTGKLFALNIWGGPTPDKQFTKYMDKISLKPENYKICRLQVPIKQASVYQAP
ncbi:MAG: hypothetical protein GY855_17395, partial [candidate division Zixibacteria bacterium]|nr:hypothetical protein [candidate division Zixibacteria bacterium]